MTPAAPDAPRPGPVVLLTALGAWLAAVPLLAVVALAFGPVFRHGGGTYLAGALLLAAAVVALRSRALPLFAEQLAVPVLLAGGASLAFGLFRDLPQRPALAALALLSLGVGLAVRAPGLKACLGAAAAGFAALVFWRPSWHVAHWTGLGWHGDAVLWVLAALRERRHGLPAALAPLLPGWAAMTLLGLALSSGMAMLVGAGLGGDGAAVLAADAGRSGWPGGVSVLLALLAAAGLGRAWPSLRRPGWAGVAAVLAGLAACMPALGAVLLMLAVSARQARWPLAAAAVLAAAWITSAFYYQLAWPLATKAGVLALAGALLGALAWTLRPRTAATATATAAPGGGARWARAGAAASLAAVLAVVNVAIARKEALIAQGQPVFLRLAPADPRSLVQGDFMRLNFALPPGLPAPAAGLRAARPQAVMALDAQRVAQFVRLHDGRPLAAGELRIELTPRDGRWTVVTDAWFFKEGEARRWSAARFGEFRVAPDGQTLLVGLRGEGLGAL
ncbi:MAG: GDYXXLXY domain-containing protein [Roseateles sp.]|uniref:GDYXXLXY domain-containing protein n=1 Tax=Roseateles sp. TaxID=1971397 RepID=UPI0039E8F6EF